MALEGRALGQAWGGDLDTASLLSAEQRTVMEITGGRKHSAGAVLLAAYRGEPSARAFLSATATSAAASGEGLWLQQSNWATAILCNALGRYEDAFAAATRAADEMYQPVDSWVYAELVEAAVRTGERGAADDAAARLSASTIASSDWACGIEARCRALLSEEPNTEAWYRAAIERLGHTCIRPELARSHLLYGEWLRRENRRVDAREQLRCAHHMFETMGAEAFAERARIELVATGVNVRKRQVDARNDLTPHEEHIARLARDGRTNPEIGAELFISARTVEWHLRKVFTKLGIPSRKDLHDALPQRPTPAN
jgi:DNA-binding CsgD family transcriptional regulator